MGGIYFLEAWGGELRMGIQTFWRGGGMDPAWHYGGRDQPMCDKKIIMLNLRDFCTKTNENATKRVKMWRKFGHYDSYHER